MRVIERMPAAVLASVLAMGCGGSHVFIYKASPAAGREPAFPMKVVVRDFEDGTPDYKTRGSIMNPGSGKTFNLTKAAMAGLSAVPADFWARFFADELRASGMFKSVDFSNEEADLKAADLVVGGRVEKCDFVFLNDGPPHEYVVRFHATKRGEKSRVWERTHSRSPVFRYEKKVCMTPWCANAETNAFLQKVMRGMFAEAVDGLAEALQ